MNVSKRPPLLLRLLCRRSQARVLDARLSQRGPASFSLVASEITDFDFVFFILVVFVGEFAFADEE